MHGLNESVERIGQDFKVLAVGIVFLVITKVENDLAIHIRFMQGLSVMGGEFSSVVGGERNSAPCKRVNGFRLSTLYSVN